MDSDNSQLISELETVAWSLYTQRNYQKSIDTYKKIIELNPDNYEAYKMAGFVCICAEKYEEAIFMYDKNLELQPKNADSYFNRGCSNLFIKHYENSISDFNKCIELCPTHPFAYFYNGVAKLFIDNKNGMADLYSSIDKGDNTYWKILLSTKDYDGAKTRNKMFHLLDELANSKPNLM